MDRNRRFYTDAAHRTVAACFLEAYVPVKKPGPGEAADPAVVALRVTPFRKVISSESPSGVLNSKEVTMSVKG